MLIHFVATCPRTTSLVSATFLTCVTTWQNSVADPVTEFAAFSSPHVQTAPDGADQAHIRNSRRQFQTPDLIGPAKCRDAEVSDVPDPVMVNALDAEMIKNLLPVRPGLHQTRGDRRARAHVRPRPFQARLRDRPWRTPPATSADSHQPFGSQRLSGRTHDIAFHCAHPAGARDGAEQTHELGLVRQLQACRAIPEMQVAHDIVERPALELRRLVECGIRQRRQQVRQRVGLCQEIRRLFHRA